MKSATKFILASLLIAFVTTTLFGLYSLDHYHDNEVKNESVRLEACLQTFWQLLNNKGSGFKIVNGKLLAGTYTVNGNFELPDKVQEIFGCVATIFMGDERVSTNVLTAQGTRALGTKLTGPAYEAIFVNNLPYRGSADILGVPYLTAYDPIRDKQGHTIGVLFVGVKESDFLARMHEMKRQMTMTLLIMFGTLSFLIILLGMAMRRVEINNENQIQFQKTLIDTIPSPLFYKDSSCRYLGCNRAFEEYTGFSQEELIGKTQHELWPKELADSYRDQDLAMFSNPGMKTYETTVLHADGLQRDVIFNKATFEDKNGAAAGLVGVIQDITERKAAEEETKEAYQQLFDIVEFLPDATFVIDRNKRVIAWNRAIELMTGVLKEDMLGKGQYAYAIPFYNDNRPLLIDLLGQDMEQERIRRNYTHIKQEGHTLYTEVFVPAFRNGESRYFWATATPLFDKTGTPVGGIESIRDITEYKRTEIEKARLESQLTYARLMKTIMIRLGHDLKTPLTPLFIMLPLLKKQLTDPSQITKIDTCMKSAVAIKNLADKTGILARLSSGAESQKREQLSLAALVDQTIGEYADLLSQKNVVCHNEISPELVICAVRGQLHELFRNLISNAVNFSNEFGPIHITATREDSCLLIRVQDHGLGIAADHLEHVFDEFFKADESRHDLEASGLGLSICKRIVKNHNGRIWAESPGLGQGTTINMTIASG